MDQISELGFGRAGREQELQLTDRPQTPVVLRHRQDVVAAQPRAGAGLLAEDPGRLILGVEIVSGEALVSANEAPKDSRSGRSNDFRSSSFESLVHAGAGSSGGNGAPSSRRPHIALR